MGHVSEKTLTRCHWIDFAKGRKPCVRRQFPEFQAFFGDGRWTVRERTDQAIEVGFRKRQKLSHGLPQSLRSVRKDQPKTRVFVYLGQTLVWDTRCTPSHWIQVVSTRTI